MKHIIEDQSVLIVKEEYVGILILLCAMITSSIYALYLEQNNIQSFQVLYNWMIQKNSKDITLECIFMSYSKRLLLLWGLGWIGGVLSIGVLFCMMFAYGFTNASLIMIFGLKGAGFAFLCYGIQAIIILEFGMILIQKSQKLLKEKGRENQKEYLLLIFPMMILILLISYMDIRLGANIRMII